MYRPYSTAAPKQLHTTLPGPNGTHACLTLYDECPHTSHSSTSLRSREPYLHCSLPSTPSTSNPRTIEYISRDGTRIVETTRSVCSEVCSSPATDYIDRTPRCAYNSSYSTLTSPLHLRETPKATNLAPLVLSKHSPAQHRLRSSQDPLPPRSILKPPRPAQPMPTIYLLTFSTDLTPTQKHFARLLNDHLPASAPLRYTIDARSFLVPAQRIQENYSGVSSVVQGAVLQDRGARRAVDDAVGELMAFVEAGGRETAVAVCCTAGTHRSVAVAECVAQGVREGVRRGEEGGNCRVVVRHVHRVRGVEDPY